MNSVSTAKWLCSRPSSHWPLWGCFLWPKSHAGPHRSSLGKWPANTQHPKALAFRKPKPCSGRGLRANGVSRNCSGMGDSSSGSPVRLRRSPLLWGRKLFVRVVLLEHGGSCHFGPLSSLPRPPGHVYLINLFLSLCCFDFYHYPLAF